MSKRKKHLEARKRMLTEAMLERRRESLAKARAVRKETMERERAMQKAIEEEHDTRPYTRNPNQENPTHQHYTSLRELAQTMDLLSIGSFEQEEFLKSGYRESTQKPHHSGSTAIGGRPRREKNEKRECLRCESRFVSEGRFNRLCKPCQGQRDFLGEEWGMSRASGKRFEES